MRIVAKLKAYATLRARRNHFDFVRYMVRRPAIAVAISTYETANILSNKTEGDVPWYRRLGSFWIWGSR